MHHRALASLTVVATALLATGCGDPYADPEPTVSTKSASVPHSANTSRSDPSQRSTASTAVRDFTKDYINWRFDDLPQTRRQLAARSTGTLRATLLQESQQALTQSSRRVSNQANSGEVQLVGKPDATGAILVITHETARLGDLKVQSGHFIYQAKVRLRRNTYKLTEFKAIN